MDITEEKTAYYFGPNSKGRGFSRIKNYIEDALELPGLDYSQRNWELDKARGIVELIKNEEAKKVYETKVQEARVKISL